MSPTSNTQARRPFFDHWGLVSAFWLLIALASMLEMSFLGPFSFTDAWQLSALQWIPWILLTPVVVWISAKYTLEKTTWRRNVWIHVAAGVAMLGCLGALNYRDRPGFGPPDGGSRGDHSRGDRPRVEHPGDGLPSSRPPPGHRDEPRRKPPSAAWTIFRLAMFQLPTYWAVVGVAHAFRFYQSAKDRERRAAELESRLVAARLDALRMQLNPHFLFNTLNSIASLVYDQPRAADEMIESLSVLLRLSLNAPDQQQVTLREELHFLDQYLRIEQTRFGDRLQVARRIDPAALNAVVPILILQPLVENAVKHGMETQVAPASISVGARRENDTLILEVIDDGRGPKLDAGGRIREGVGLGNARARLRELYGDRGSFHYEAGRSRGFRVTLQFPWQTLPPSAAKPS